MTSWDKYIEYIDNEADCLEHKRYMRNSDKCFTEWCEENNLNPEE